MKQILCFGDSNTYGLIPATKDRYDWNTRWTGILSKKIEKNGYTKIIAAQSSHLLELFLQKKEEEYILNDSDIKKELWPDGSGDIYRIHKAITRLRSIIHEFDVSIEIIRGVETYQLLL